MKNTDGYAPPPHTPQDFLQAEEVNVLERHAYATYFNFVWLTTVKCPVAHFAIHLDNIVCNCIQRLEDIS